jgi:outer membrane translocation and assembly module TamA
MNPLANLNIGPRLGLAFAAVIALAVMVAAIGISRLSTLTDSITLIGNDRVPKVQKLADITDNVNLIARELRNTLVWDDATKVAGALETVKTARADIARTFETLAPTITSEARVTDIMGEISSASTEQSQGLSQVGEAVSQMDQVTQQNAALVEESAAAADSLKQQAVQLVNAVAVFKLGANAAQQPMQASPKPSAAFVERRGPDRATNVTRPAFAKGQPTPAAVAAEPLAPQAAAARTGTDDWAQF